MIAVRRMIRGYEIEGDVLLVEYLLPGNVGLNWLRCVFGAEADDEMLDCFVISSRHMLDICNKTGIDLSGLNMAFFLEADGGWLRG